MRITKALERATTRTTSSTEGWSDDQFRESRELDLQQPTMAIRDVVIATVICLVLSMLLVSAKLVDIAERQPLGESRDRWLSGAESIDRISNFLSLNRPYDLIVEIRGTGNDPGERIDSIDDVAAAAGLSGSDSAVDTTAGAVGQDPTPGVDDDVATGEDDGLTTATVATPTTTVAAPIRVVTPSTPLRTFVAGDSQAEFIGLALMEESGSGLVDVSVDYRVSTSLARPGYFNWPAEIAAVVATDDPELVVMVLGANDWQDMEDSDGSRLVRGTEEWRSEWSRRLDITFDLLAADHRHVVWVSQPPMRNGELQEGVGVINELATVVVAARHDVTLIDIWVMFGGDGTYLERVASPEGDVVRARNDDGVHLNRRAAGWVGDLVMIAVGIEWDLDAG